MAQILIADTSCLISLYNANILDILKNLFGEILITDITKEEFGQPLPNWIKIENPKDKIQLENLFKELDKGEASAIALALENENYKIIIDELKGRKMANDLGIQTTGTLAILILAKEKDLITNFKTTVDILITNGFRLSDKLYREVIRKYNSE